MREAEWAPWLSFVTSSTPPVRKYNNRPKHDTHYSLITHLPLLRHTDISRQVRSKLFSLPKSRDIIHVCLCVDISVDSFDYSRLYFYLYLCITASTMESKKLLILASIRQPMADHSNKVTHMYTHTHTFLLIYFLTIMLLDG